MYALLVLYLAAFAVAQKGIPVKFCQKGTLPSGWQPNQAVGKLNQQSQFLLANTSLDLVCSGTVVVVDGCSFYVQDFTYSDPSTSAWYAGVGSGADGVVFSETPVTTSNATDSPTYQLKTVVGAAYAWTSITQLRLFDTANQQLIW
ncbi:hypothetical protein HDU98_003919 [Podochytrium sp. JEL0797]|nr:hypothetical protein HDU98_003919 [Podochytrium sp. JEL0797]